MYAQDLHKIKPDKNLTRFEEDIHCTLAEEL